MFIMIVITRSSSHAMRSLAGGILIILLNVVRCQCSDGDVSMNFFGGDNIDGSEIR